MDFTHFDASGNAHMVDVSEKAASARKAVAVGSIVMSAACYEKVKSGQMGKGDVLGVARIAGIMGLKRTAELVPLCHSIPIRGAEISFVFHDADCRIEAICTVRTVAVTGVEMEALTGVQVALLTVYDMCKAVDRGMRMTDIYLREKTGGKSGHFHNKYVESAQEI